MTDSRPAHFAPGTPIGKFYTVEGLVRLTEGRMFYLVNDERPDTTTRKCWSCEFEGSPRTAKVCHNCGAPLVSQRFLMSSRWGSARFDAYEAFGEMKLEHPGLASPTDVVRLDDQLLSFVPYKGEGLMVDEACPFANHRILHIAQRVAGTVMYLATRGVQITTLTQANLLISPNGAVRLFDLEIGRTLDGPLPDGSAADVLRDVGVMLRRYCHVQSSALADFLELVASGDYPTPRDFGRAVESRFDTYSALAFQPSIGAMSDVGLTRQLNEDNWGWTRLNDRAELYVVADGMGGHEGGEVASKLAVESISAVAREFSQNMPETVDAIETMLDEAFQAANNTIKGEAERRSNDMGTTLVAMLLHDNRQGFFANVGDSRAYLFRNRTLHQISVDHSLVQKMVERGRITQEEARNHPHSNILLRTVGTERNVQIDIFRVELVQGDRVLLCTDGLWGEVDDDDIASVLSTYNDPRVASRELVRAAHQGGGKDNVTLQLTVII